MDIGSCLCVFIFFKNVFIFEAAAIMIVCIYPVRIFFLMTVLFLFISSLQLKSKMSDRHSVFKLPGIIDLERKHSLSATTIPGFFDSNTGTFETY